MNFGRTIGLITVPLRLKIDFLPRSQSNRRTVATQAVVRPYDVLWLPSQSAAGGVAPRRG
jgi:hypothetical protein